LNSVFGVTVHPHESNSSREDDREDVCLLGGGTSLIERTTDKALAFARSSHPDFDRTLPGPSLSMRPSSREWSRGLRSTAKKKAPILLVGREHSLLGSTKVAPTGRFWFFFGLVEGEESTLRAVGHRAEALLLLLAVRAAAN